jgi:hypothetical protein
MVKVSDGLAKGELLNPFSSIVNCMAPGTSKAFTWGTVNILKSTSNVHGLFEPGIVLTQQFNNVKSSGSANY